MKRDFKRVVSAALATVMVAQAGGVSALAAPLTTQSTTTTSATPTAAGMHQFTGTPDLIKSTIEELKAKGVTYQKEETDKALVKRVETASDKSYAAVKTDLAQALVDQREDGTVDVSDLGLTQKDMAAVLQETLYDKFMNHAVTDVTYQTEGGKVTGINYNMSEGFAAAMDAIDDEQQAVEVDTDAVASEVAEQVAQEGGQPAAIALFDAEDGSGTSDGETGSGDAGETTGCKNHTVGEIVTLKGDLDGDGVINGKDLTIMREMTVKKRDVDMSADLDGDGVVNGKDLTILREITVKKRDPEKTVTGSDINWEWAETSGKSGTTGLYYDVVNHQIAQGDLPDYYYELSKVSFTCSECGQTIEITDANALSQMVSRYDVYVNTETHNTVTVNHGSKPTASDIKDGENLKDYIQYTDMAVASYTDDTFSVDENGQPVTDEKGNVIGLYTDNADNGELQVKNYYAQLSAFNADNAQFFGVSTPFWTSKNSEANPMAAVKVLCNQDADAQIPPSQMLQMVQMLPQAFMSYVYQYGSELLLMRDKALEVAKQGKTEVQKQLLLHDWLADNCTFDMGVMTTVNSSGGNPNTDPMQMTTFGALLSDQFSEMPTYVDSQTHQKAYYNGAICLGYTAAYTYLIQNLHTEVYKDGDNWKTPEQVGKDVLVDFIQAKFYADTANTSVAGEGFGGGAFNNVHYMNAVRLPGAENKGNGEWFYTDVCYDDIYIECMAQYRGEVQGSIYHTYFLMSPQSIATLYEKGNSIDYIDSLYDGYTYQIVYQKNEDGSIKTDDKGNKLVEPSENIDKGKKYYDETHPKYEKVAVTDGSETKNDNTSYEDSWFSGAVSRIYTDGTNWYYVDGGKTMASQRQSAEKSDQKDQMEDMVNFETYMHASRVNVENANELKTRPMTATDYLGDSKSSNSYETSSNTDNYATTLFNYGTGKFDEAHANAPVLDDEAKQAFIYTEQYPALTHSIGLYDGKIYFNLGNAIYTYDTKAASDANPVSLYREYNDVTFSQDEHRNFPATSFYMDYSATPTDKNTVTNHPIAGLEIYEDYDFSRAYDENGNFVAGEVKTNPVMTVNIATNFSFSYPDVQDASRRYTEEAINYNPDYQRQISSSDANTNTEFLWCANIRDTVKMSDLAADTDTETATVAASCTSPAYTQTRTKTYGLAAGNKEFTGEAASHNYVYNSKEKAYICDTCKLQASVLLTVGEGGEAKMTSVASSGFKQSMGSYSNDAVSIDPEREAATKAKDGKITLTVNPDEDYEVVEVYYVEAVADTTDTDDKTENGGDSEAATQADTTEETKVQLTKNDDGTYTITKPEACINVHVTFKKTVEEKEAHKIDTSDIKDGTVVATVDKKEVTEAKADDVVTLTVTANPGFELNVDSVTVTPVKTAAQADDGETPKDDNTTTPDKVTLTRVGDGVYTFVMPDAEVKITAKFVKVEAKKYAINLPEEPENGTVTATVNGKVATEAVADAEVTLTLTPVSGASVATNGVKVTAGDDPVELSAPVTTEDGSVQYTFKMPASAVDVGVTFTQPEPTVPPQTKTYTVALDPESDMNGFVTAEVDGVETKEVAAGKDVTLVVKPDTDYVLDTISATYENADGEKAEVKLTQVDDTHSTFTMPAGNVSVKVTFKAATSGEPDSSETTNE